MVWGIRRTSDGGEHGASRMLGHMNSEGQDAAKLAELKARLEEVAGRELDITDEQLLWLSWPVSSSTYEAAQNSFDDAWISNLGIISPQPTCADAELLDTCGYATTGSGGQVTFRLRSVLCARHDLDDFSEPVNLLATPQATAPFFMTVNHELIANNSDLQITVYAWNPGGTPAANVSFYWRCRLPATTIVDSIGKNPSTTR
jgi:hypothetical protein